MSKHGSAKAVLAGAVLIALAGCTGVGTATAPDVPGQAAGSSSAAASSLASTAAPVSTARPSATSKPFVKADSIPFPVAVGNTWVYRTRAGGATGRTTNTIVAAGPGAAGYRVTMSSTTDVAGTAATIQPVYVFYPDGTIGFPVPPVTGLSAADGRIRWPDAAGLASGRAYHSVLRVQVSQATQDADVTVHGAGTMSVTVPAGTYQASVVQTTIAAKGMTVEVTTWIAQGVGPVKTEVLIKAAGEAGLTTSELLSFTKATSAVGDGS
jgi:hypothetical protein